MKIGFDDIALPVDLWTLSPTSEEPPQSSDTVRFAVWLIKTRGDPYWNPDLPKTDQDMPAWQVEMVRLIDVYQHSGGYRRCPPRGHSSRQTHAPPFAGSDGRNPATPDRVTS